MERNADNGLEKNFMNNLIFNDDTFVPSRFEPLPKLLNGHRLFYKGKADSVKETKEEQALAEVASQKWELYKKDYRPLEDKYMGNVEAQNSDGAHSFAKGVAASATSEAFDDARKKTQTDLNSAGINPNSGHAKLTMAGLSDIQGGSSAEAKARASNSQDDSYVDGLKNIVAIGNNQSTTATAGLSDIAHSANEEASRKAQDAFNNKAAGLSTLGTLAGAVTYGAV